MQQHMQHTRSHVAGLTAVGVASGRLAGQSYHGFALPHIDIVYDKQTHQLREYRGVSHIRRGDGRNLSVIIQFPPSERRADVSEAEVDLAARQPLTGRCLLP
jgi:hypothetical protein